MSDLREPWAGVLAVAFFLSAIFFHIFYSFTDLTMRRDVAESLRSNRHDRGAGEQRALIRWAEL